MLPLHVWLCLLFGEVHKLSERNMYTDNLFFARSCKILTKVSCKVQETQLLPSFCKKWESVARLLQEFCKIYFQICQSCKICIFYKNFEKVVLIAEILQKLFFCELGLPWPCHDHGETWSWSWSCHDDSHVFLPWSSWFMAWSWYDYRVFHDSYYDHGMIIMFSKLSFEKK